MEWKANDIRQNFHGIIKDCRNATKDQLTEKYSKFKEEFPKLFDLALESIDQDTVQKNLQLLEMMLKKRQEQLDGKASKMNTDMFVGNQLGKEFIYPKTGGPSRKDYDKAVSKIQKGEAMKHLSDSVGQPQKVEMEESS